MSALDLIGLLLGGAGFMTALITALRSPAALLSYAQANKISTDRINELEKKLAEEREACRDKINVLASVIADLIQNKAISQSSRKKLNEKLSMISEPKIT